MEMKYCDGDGDVNVVLAAVAEHDRGKQLAEVLDGSSSHQRSSEQAAHLGAEKHRIHRSGGPQRRNHDLGKHRSCGSTAVAETSWI